MGVLPVARGGVSLDGADITRLAPHQRARGMAYVPQGRDIFARLTVEENILMGMATAGRARGASRRKCSSCSPCCAACCRGAAAICRADSSNSWRSRGRWWPSPASSSWTNPPKGYSRPSSSDIGRVIRTLRQRGDIGILLCEQYFDFARELADRYMVPSRGEVVASGGRETMDGEDVRRHLSV